MSKPTIELNAILIPDDSGGFSAFFAQFPEAIAEGDNEQEAMQNLLEIFSIMLKDRSEESRNSISNSGYPFTTKPVNLIFA